MASFTENWLCNGVDAVIKAYRLYLNSARKAATAAGGNPSLDIARFVESGLLQLSSCNCCGGNFITHAHQPVGSLCRQLMSAAIPGGKRRKLFQNPADIIPQLLDEQSTGCLTDTVWRNIPAATMPAVVFAPYRVLTPDD
ncbi:hypothetical protein DMI62_19875 [Escherichia coli]|nr:hypothetical protein [Escherichia coli]